MENNRFSQKAAPAKERLSHSTDKPFGSPAEVFWAFLKLGLTSFGGPIAHLGYFREEFVVRRKWIDEAGYADLIALCQFLPGPASSQVGFSLGVLRSGSSWGGLAAWLAFTMPSALVLFACALGAAAFTGPIAQGLVHGLKLVAVAVVAQAIWGMARNLTPDRERVAIALAAIALVILLPGSSGQIAALGIGAVAGLGLCKAGSPLFPGHIDCPVSRRAGVIALCLFALLFSVPPLIASVSGNHGAELFNAFYRSGALVFGGGHVVLPLLQAEVVSPGWVTDEAFLSGYGLAQAVPGPLFTFAAYLGAIANLAPTGLAGASIAPTALVGASVGPAGVAGASIALIAVFLPGLLLVYGTLPFWDALRTRPAAQAAMRGANAAVVGILASAFYSPVWTSAIFTRTDFLIALAGFLLLTTWKIPPWIVVVLLAAAGMLSHIL